MAQVFIIDNMISRTGLSTLFRAHMAENDRGLMYIAKQSIATDFRIILGTIKVIFMPESTEGISEGEVTADEGTDDSW